MPQAKGTPATELSVDQQTCSQQLHDLLLSFPAAAVAGVQWKVLMQKYLEHHGTMLDWEALGHATPLAAATWMLPEVLRVVNVEDVDNPFIGIEDKVALVPHPGLLGCWPSLYRALCNIVLKHGSSESVTEGPSDTDPPMVRSVLLLAQLRPLLQADWHSQFDDNAMGYCCDDGRFKRVKKIKHMLLTIFKLREQRQTWQKSSGLDASEVDDAIAPLLEIMPSQRHSDIVLRCTRVQLEHRQPEEAPRPEPWLPTSAQSEVGFVPSMTAFELQLEIERLRSDNRKLRTRNCLLEEHCILTIPEAGISPPSSPGRRGGQRAESDETPRLVHDFFDNPFEPPPQKRAFVQMTDGAPPRQSRTHSSSDVGSTDMGGSALTTNFSDWQSGCTSASISGTNTPAMRSPFARPGCAYVPMWFPFMNATQSGFDVSIIPSGIVQETCALLEPP